MTQVNPIQLPHPKWYHTERAEKYIPGAINKMSDKAIQELYGNNIFKILGRKYNG